MRKAPPPISDETLEQKVAVKNLNFVQNLPKKTLLIVLAIVAAILILVITLFINSRPIKVIDVVKPEFVGYNTMGTIKWNESEFIGKVEKAIEDKYSVNDIKSMGKAFEALASIHFSFDKSKNLKNGDEVTFKITSSMKNCPIQLESKTFKVDGLKDLQKLSNDQILDAANVQVKGMSGVAECSYNDNNLILEGSKKDIKNGDVLKFAVKKTYQDKLLSEGKIPEFTTVQKTVTGLTEITDLKNTDKVFAEIDKLAAEKYKETKIFGSKQVCEYAKVKDCYRLHMNTFEGGALTLVRVYKVKISIISASGAKTSEREFYEVLGYRSLAVDQDLVVLSRMQPTSEQINALDEESLDVELKKNYKDLPVNK